MCFQSPRISAKNERRRKSEQWRQNPWLFSCFKSVQKSLVKRETVALCFCTFEHDECLFNMQNMFPWREKTLGWGIFTKGAFPFLVVKCAQETMASPATQSLPVAVATPDASQATMTSLCISAWKSAAPCFVNHLQLLFAGGKADAVAAACSTCIWKIAQNGVKHPGKKCKCRDTNEWKICHSSERHKTSRNVRNMYHVQGPTLWLFQIPGKVQVLWKSYSYLWCVNLLT